MQRDPADRLTPRIANSQDILQAVIDATPDAIFVKDLDGRYVLVNEAAARFIGKSPEEIVGKLDLELYPEETARVFIEADRQVLASGEAQTFEGVATGDGITQAYLVTKGVYRDKHGKVLGLFGISHDITERKRAEEAIRKSKEHRNLFVLASDPIVIFAPDTGVVVDVNDKACDVYGFTRDAFIGKSFKDLSEDVQACEEHWARLLAEGAAPEFEAVQFRADRTRVHFLISASLIDYQGRKAILSINRDITERKRIAVELEQARDAALESVRLKSEFLANMSHEIRTPMNGILGMTELALDTKLTMKQREYLDMVKMSAESLLAVIDDILDFSKIEAGKLTLDPIEFDLQEAVGDTIKPLAIRAHQKGLELTYRVARNVPTTVVGDPHRLRQIVVNLVGNAIKFTERGEVSVMVELGDPCREGVQLHFTVADTGIGIPRDKQALIFQAFAQADGSTTRQYGGTGLGLAITSQLVDLMGGRIWVESPAGGRDPSDGEGGPGSAFHFTVRLQRGEVPACSPDPLVATLGVRVLVVDDNRTNRRILEEVLANWHMKPTLVDGGRGALAELKRAARGGNPFTVVLLDAHMPEMDGFAVVKAIRATPELSQTIIMMLSSAQEHVHADRCRDLGLAAYLTKPIKLSELRTAITQVLGSEPHRTRISDAVDKHAPRGRRLRVLLVEDTVINQRLAASLLGKRGHAVEIAGNGRDALAAIERAEFDLVLMDVQMPEMNGLQATEEIRRREQTTLKRLPIIAMTAHAMKGDRERCLAAGMDGYISKPIRFDELWGLIDQLVPAETEKPAQPRSTPALGAAFDPAMLLNRVEGDTDLAHELATVFLQSAPELVAQIRDAIARRNGDLVARAAHSMKSSVGYFVRTGATEAAERLEQAGVAGDFAAAPTLLTTLEEHVDQLRDALAAFVKERAA